MCDFSLESLGSEQMAIFNTCFFECVYESWYPSGTGNPTLEVVFTFVTYIPILLCGRKAMVSERMISFFKKICFY